MPGWRHSRVALLVVATDEELMVTQHAAALPRGRTEERATGVSDVQTRRPRVTAGRKPDDPVEFTVPTDRE